MRCQLLPLRNGVMAITERFVSYPTISLASVPRISRPYLTG